MSGTDPVRAGRGRGRAVAVTVAMVASLLGAAFTAVPASAGPGDITTYAGTESFDETGGDGGPATLAQLNRPYGLALHSGNLFVSENWGNVVRRVAPDGTITTVAGGGAPVGDGQPATSAVLVNPNDVAVDGSGNLFVADSLHNRVRRVDAGTGLIATVAGDGSAGFGGDGGPATAAQIDYPSSVAVDGSGNLFVADSNNDRVRKVDAATGVITTVAGGGDPPDGLGDGGPATDARFHPSAIAASPAGDVFIADVSAGRVRKVDAATGVITTMAGTGPAEFSAGDGGPATEAQVPFPEDVNLDPAGNVYIDTVIANRIRRVDAATGIITTVAGTDEAGFSGDGGPATSATLDFPLGVAADGSGNVVISDYQNNRLRRVSPSGIIDTVAGDGTAGFVGDGGTARSARIFSPIGVAYDAAGNVFFADSGNDRIRKIDTAGVITTVAGGGVGDGLPATSALLSSPRGLVTDAAGNLLVADCGNHRVRRIDASGIISTLAGGGSPANGVGDGGAATSAALRCPSGLAVAGPAGAGASAAPASTVFVADCAANRVRRIDPSGVITTVAGTGAAGFAGDGAAATKAKLSCPSDVALDAGGNLLVADETNHRVRRIDAATGKISTVAGNGTVGFGVDGVVATKTSLTRPQGVALDPGGNLLITDRYARVRRVDASTARISTVAGEGIPGFTGDGGPATRAHLLNPTQVRFDPAGNFFVSDRGNNRVRRVEAGTPPPPPVPPIAGCGQVITRNTTLQSDIGPCDRDGLIVGADGITLNLNGHHIFGSVPSDGTGGDGNSAGIRLTGRTGVTVKGAAAPGPSQGSVSGFNAGVAIVGGSKNTVTNLTARDNTGSLDYNVSSALGDGIVLMFSPGNTITNNVVARNGPYDGIGGLGKGTDNNTIQGNTVTDTFTYPDSGGCDGTGEGIIFNPFLDDSLPRGVTVSGNKILDNTVSGNATAGISNLSDIGSLIKNNTVTDNGKLITVNDPEFGEFTYSLCPGTGIGVQALMSTPSDTRNVVEGNRVHGSGSDGIQVPNTHKNRILSNVSTGNGRNGFGTDLADYSNSEGGPDCTDNVWSGNTWGIAGYYPDCTSTGGSGPTPESAPVAPASAASANRATSAAGATELHNIGASPRRLAAADLKRAKAASG